MLLRASVAASLDNEPGKSNDDARRKSVEIGEITRSKKEIK